MKPGVLSVGDEPPPMTPKTKPDAGKPKRKAGERFGLLNAFADFSMGELTRGEIIVWLILFRDSRDGIARTAQNDIARRGRIDRKTVGRCIRRLEKRGLVKTVHRGGFRKGVSRYRVLGLGEADSRGT